MYLLYGSSSGYCVKEDETSKIFEAAVRCLMVDDPFATVHGKSAAPLTTQPVIEVNVDQEGHVVWGGTGQYLGWSKGTDGGPEIVAGPGAERNGLKFEDGRWLQIGDNGVQLEREWTIDLFVRVSLNELESSDDSAVLISSAEASTDGLLTLTDVAAALQTIASTEPSWHRLTVQQQILDNETSLENGGHQKLARRTVFVDGELSAVVSLDSTLASVLSVGASPTGTSAFPLHMFRLRIFAGLVDCNVTQPTLVGSSFPFHGENSQWFYMSRGVDGVDLRWSTFGWERSVEKHTRVHLEPDGSLVLSADNVSSMWDRAVASVGSRAVTGDGPATTNWSSSAMNTTRSPGLLVKYESSDPCYDLWSGVQCSPSNWVSFSGHLCVATNVLSCRCV